MHQMDPYEVTRLMYAKVQSVDPKNVSKIMGYLLLQDQAEQEMLVALGSDAFLCSMVAKAKNDLGLAAADAPSWPSTDQSIPPLQFPVTTQSNHLIPMPSDHSAVGAGLYHAQNMYPLINSHFPAASFYKQQQQQGFHRNNISNQDSHQHQHQQHQALFGGMFPNDHFYPESFAFLNKSRLKQQQQQQQLDDVINSHSEHGSPNSSGSNSNAWKPCVYFSRGHCKHGSSCRFLHIPNSASTNGQAWEDEWEDERPLPLEKLEMELQELLRGRKTPIPVATLPQLYYENFGKPLQAEKYLTESQRLGKAGSSLTKLLPRLKSTVVLIDQSHGQQALALVEDVSRFAGHRGENYDHSANSPSSRQIYLTFPAESTFSEEDVSAHFSAYGAVQDVRIPYQQKRMFGFVTFLHSDTVKVILSEGNPHYICGARVLVKPYREKGKHSDNHRKNSDQSRYFQNGNNALTNRDVLASKLFEENMLAIQLQRGNSLHLERRLAELQLASVQKYCVEAQAHASMTTSREQLQNSNGKLHRIQDEVSPHQNSNLRCLLGAPNGEIDDSLDESHNASNSQLGTESLPESPFAVAYDIKQEVALCTSEMEGFNLNDSSSSEVNQQLQRYHTETEQEFY